MKYPTLLLALFLPCAYVFVIGQDLHTATIEKDTIPYWHRSSLKGKFPNRPLQLIIVDTLISKDTSDRYWSAIDNRSTNGEWHQVMVSLPAKQSRQPKQLKKFIDYIFSSWFFDRNRIHVILDSEEMAANLPREDWMASMWIPPHLISGEGQFSWNESEFRELNPSLSLGTQFELTRMGDMNDYEERRERIGEYSRIGGSHTIALTGGYYRVGDHNLTTIDEGTLTDLREVSSLWTLNYTYMRNERLGLVGQLAVSVSANTTSDVNRTTYGTFVNGEGSGAVLTKMGLGVRYVPFKTGRWHFYAESILGYLNVRIDEGEGAGSLTGGSSVVTTNDSRGTYYVDLSLGAQYRLGRRFYLNGNIMLSQSQFNREIGAVSGLSGSGFNIGLGFVF